MPIFEEGRLESIRHSQNYKVSDEYFLCLSVPGGFVCLLVLFSRSKEHETIWESDMPAGGNTAAFEICVFVCVCVRESERERACTCAPCVRR